MLAIAHLLCIQWTGNLVLQGKSLACYQRLAFDATHQIPDHEVYYVPMRAYGLNEASLGKGNTRTLNTKLTSARSERNNTHWPTDTQEGQREPKSRAHYGTVEFKLHWINVALEQRSPCRDQSTSIVRNQFLFLFLNVFIDRSSILFFQQMANSRRSYVKENSILTNATAWRLK